MTLNKEEREESLRRMKAVSNNFYLGAIQVNNHAFIEFCGLMNEYIKACEAAHNRGEDFTELNVHGGKHLKLEDYEIDYINEKMGCIYGLELKEREHTSDS